MDIEQKFRDLIGASEYPCVGAKTALTHDSIQFVVAGDLRLSDNDAFIARALQQFAVVTEPAAMFVSMVVLFEDTPPLSENVFEDALWQRLQAIHDIDAHTFAWDADVSDDPASPDFAFSVGGRGFFVIGMHPGASRKARRFDCPALVFNLHDQFEQLRREGRFDKFSDIIADRDRTFCGSVNPMLAQHGESSDAPQYSGREVDADWRCPFHSRRVSSPHDS